MDAACDTSPHAYAQYTRLCRKEARELELITQESGLPSGLPQFAFGDEITSPSGTGRTARMMQALEQGLKDDRFAQQRTEEESEANTAPFVGPPSPVLRNSWFMQVRKHGYMREIYVEIMEMNPDAPPHLRRIRLTKNDCGEVAGRRAEMLIASYNKTISRQFAFIEEKAMKKLRSLVAPHEYASYLLTGAFCIEGRSGVRYLLRKGRPTLALRYNEEGIVILCTLCCHPLGYHDSTWAGVLPPTDEVVAHLLMIRGDEHFFWRKSNQHHIGDTTSGI